MGNKKDFVTQMSAARAGIFTDEMRFVLQQEKISESALIESLARGSIAIPANRCRPFSRVCGFGSGLRTKVNVNLGISEDVRCLDTEWRKVDVAVKHGADAIMDLSVGNSAAAFRRELRKRFDLALGTVPMYDAALRYGKEVWRLSVDEIFDVVEEHAKDGVDFMTIHAGLTKTCLERLQKTRRLTHVVSRGGSILMEWMIKNDRENPFYEHFPRLLEICRKYDVTISLGDGLRPGSLADATDAAQLQELILLGELTRVAWENDVQIMIEGPGHIPLNEVAANIQVAKKLTHQAPLYVLGPLVTDIGAGFDHISAAIGGAVASWSGADFLCYVTPAEHLRLPTVSDVEEGLIATRLAAHAGDVAKGIPEANHWDKRVSTARGALLWGEMFAALLYPERARGMWESQKSADGDACSMCGSLCAMKRSKPFL